MEPYKIYLDNILRNTPGSIYWKDKEGRYLGCNAFQARMADVSSAAEMIGKTDYELPWKKSADVIRATDKRIMETQQSESLIETALLTDNTKIIMLTNKAPLYDEKGKVIGIIGTSLDITARIEAEQREKEALAAAATASEARRKTEEEAKRAIMVMAGSIAHDLRTPLLTLSLINQRLKKSLSGGLAKAQPQELEDIQDRIDEVIQDMHLFIDHNLKALKHSTSDSLKEEALIECKSYWGIMNALDSYPFKAGERELITVDTSYYFDFPGNPVLFLRILFNLLSNALYQIQGTGKGEIFITCGQEKSFNFIRFKDTAGGAPASVVAHIFDGYKTTKKEGTGIGLAFCKLTMESFGGQMECHSVEGDFIEFVLKFPKMLPETAGNLNDL